MEIQDVRIKPKIRIGRIVVIGTIGELILIKKKEKSLE
jgi:hypothetical protein